MKKYSLIPVIIVAVIAAIYFWIQGVNFSGLLSFESKTTKATLYFGGNVMHEAPIKDNDNTETKDFNLLIYGVQSHLF